MASVYIETTIPSFYYETRSTPSIVGWQESTRRWWNLERHRFELWTSKYVLAELRLAPKR